MLCHGTQKEIANANIKCYIMFWFFCARLMLNWGFSLILCYVNLEEFLEFLQFVFFWSYHHGDKWSMSLVY